MRIYILPVVILLAFLIPGCKDNTPTGSGIEPPAFIPPVICDSPVWHPDGNLIGFNYLPLKSIQYSPSNSSFPEQFDFLSDSVGFYLISPDGSHLRRAFPYMLQSPAWSSDGRWIAFVSNAQIYKMKFTGTGFDTTTIEQLTNEGRNFFPVWSPDSKWIAYTESICDGVSKCGLWLMSSDGKGKSFLAKYASYPHWNPNGKEILYSTRTITSKGEETGDSLWIFDIQSQQKKALFSLTGINNDNRGFRYSPDGKNIAFTSQPLGNQVNLWIMNAAGGNLRQITSQGTGSSSGTPFSWSPDGKFIVYTKYRWDSWLADNGTLWILDLSSGQQKQLTTSLIPQK